MSLPVTIAPGDAGHATFHNNTNAQVNTNTSDIATNAANIGKVTPIVQTIAKSGGTTTLSGNAPQIVWFTGAGAQTVKLPDATTLSKGIPITIYNLNVSGGDVTINDGSGAFFDTVNPFQPYTVVLIDNSTVAGVWAYFLPQNLVAITGGTLDNVTIGNAGYDSYGYFRYLESVILDNGTNTTPRALRLSHQNNAAGTPVAGFGVGLNFESEYGDLSLTHDIANLIASWSTTNPTSRKGKLVIQIADTALHDVITIDAPNVITLLDGSTIVLGASGGNKIGTATSQKLGFWNATPIVQPSGASQAAVAATASSNVAPFGYTTAAQADAIVTLLNAIRTALVSAGIMKGSA